MRTRALLAVTALALGLVACDEDSNPTGVEPTANAEHAQLDDIVYEIVHLASLGGTASSGNGINNRGLVVGSSNLPGGNMHAALWDDGTPIDLGTLGGPHSNVAWPGINTSGTMIVGIAETAEPGGETWACQFFFPTATGSRCLGFVYENGVMSPLPTFPGGTNGFATGANSRGQVVGWAENDVEDPTCNAPVTFQFRAAVWEPRRDGMTELAPLPGDSTSAATAINERGQVVGISGDCANAVGGFSARHAVLWEKDGSVSRIGDLGGEAWHTPMDINNHGEVVGFGNPDDVPGAAFGIEAFYWSAHAGIDSLGVLPGQVTSQALGINNRGQVVGTSSGSPDGGRAFIWDGGEIIDLNDLADPDYEGTLRVAGHINDAGVITGVALDPDTGDEVTFVATPTGAGNQ
ncbi:MAG: hypothetical protein ACODAB_05160 [Gemmatimonadota bacterium]